MKRKWVILLIALSSISILTISLVLIIFLFFNGIGWNDMEKSTRIGKEMLRFQEVNPTTNFTSLGFVNLNTNILSDRNFLTYFNQITGNHIIISRFGGSTYECLGHCFCQDEERRNTQILTRGLRLVFSTLSISLAFQIAKEAFEENCKRENLNCHPQIINSKVSHCSISDEEDNKIDDESDVDIAMGRILREEEHESEYECNGHCIPNESLYSELPKELVLTASRASFGTCDNLKVEGTVTTYFHQPKIAEMLFITEYLEPMCGKMSRFRHNNYDQNSGYQDYEACLSHDKETEEDVKEFPNVHCNFIKRMIVTKKEREKRFKKLADD